MNLHERATVEPAWISEDQTRDRARELLRAKWRRREVRRRRAAAESRLALIITLGGRCATCGETQLDRLEIDHPNGRDWHPRKLGQPQRIARYRAEAAAGLVRVLCQRCNGSDGEHRKRQR